MLYTMDVIEYSIRVFRLFCGFMLDGSCRYYAVTEQFEQGDKHILRAGVVRMHSIQSTVSLKNCYFLIRLTRDRRI
jgi:hypothetical protein